MKLDLLVLSVDEVLFTGASCKPMCAVVVVDEDQQRVSQVGKERR